VSAHLGVRCVHAKLSPPSWWLTWYCLLLAYRYYLLRPASVRARGEGKQHPPRAWGVMGREPHLWPNHSTAHLPLCWPAPPPARVRVRAQVLFELQSRRADRQAWSTLVQQTSTPTTFTVFDLEPGTKYAFRWAALRGARGAWVQQVQLGLHGPRVPTHTCPAAREPVGRAVVRAGPPAHPHAPCACMDTHASMHATTSSSCVRAHAHARVCVCVCARVCACIVRQVPQRRRGRSDD